MTTPEHITRIIERLDPVDRDTLELHLNSQEKKHKDLLRSYQDLQALRNRSGVDLEHALRGTVREGAWQPDDTLKRVAALSQERNALGRERNELSASCHQLTKALRWVVDDVKADDPEMWGFAERVLAATPATHLAEVRAQAIVDFVSSEVPKLDPDNPEKLCPETHHCEYTLYRERERIHSAADRIRKDTNA